MRHRRCGKWKEREALDGCQGWLAEGKIGFEGVACSSRSGGRIFHHPDENSASCGFRRPSPARANGIRGSGNPSGEQPWRQGRAHCHRLEQTVARITSVRLFADRAGAALFSAFLPSPRTVEGGNLALQSLLRGSP